MKKKWVCRMEGDCCKAVQAVTVTGPELKALYEARPDVHLHITEIGLPDGRTHYQFAAGPCPFLAADGKCSVYEVRPYNCRRWMCGRMSHDEPLTDLAPVPMKVLLDRDLRRQYDLNQRRARAQWAHKMGWQE